MTKTFNKMNGRVVFNANGRGSAISHAPVDPPLCLDCRQSDLALFDPSCPWCLEIVKNPRTAIAEIFAIMRQWVPETQKNIGLFVSEILNRGAHVDERDGSTDMTLLHYSCKAGAAAVGDVNTALKVVKILIEKGANVHLTCCWTNMNALHYATHFDVAPILRFILEECKDMNVNIQCPNYDGYTALHIAAKNLCLDAAKVLLEYRADINAKDIFSRTPYECIPDVSLYCNLPDVPDKIIKMKKLLAHNSQSLTESTSTKSNIISKLAGAKDSKSLQSLSKVQVNQGKVDVSKITSKVCCGIIEGHEYRGLKIGDQVLFYRNSETQHGKIRFIGKTEFASGFWVGMELDKESSDRHDGMIEGTRYFQCPPHRGLFILASKLLRNLAVCKQISYGKETHAFKWRKGYALSRSQFLCATNEGKRSTFLHSLPVTHSLSRENAQAYFLLRSRNKFASLLGMAILYNHKLGVIKYIGQVDFAEGYWFGLELKEQKGKHDGIVKGKRYFKCKPGHGIMVTPKNVTLLNVNADKLCKLLSA